MDTLKLDLNKRYTYADYLTWMDNVSRELYNGFIKLMTPSPSRKHQLISTNLVSICWNYLRNKNCEVYHAPSDVRFPTNKKDKADNSIYTVLQPDLYVVCDLSKLDDRGCLGAPDFIIEIVSAQNSKRDIKDKFEIYQNHGVREYWIVNPNDENVNVFLLDKKGKYQLGGMFAGDDKIPVHIFNGDLRINLIEVFS
ncbi:MAG: Uma2 family endonuclease [Bacteroidales bacterium]|nr:Uma2 family endonuclease [Bacteroidales bacterium]MCF8455479.1 Uma2 family endonuclease [Bacteroidales bacterium]